MDEEEFISEEDWKIIIGNVPVVTVDLLIQRKESILLGKRQNKPEKGEWFVPGGRVLKNESLTEAAHRIAFDELGIKISIEQRLGSYDHFHDSAEADGINSKHNVAVGFLVRHDQCQIQPDNQHESVRAFKPPFSEIDLHPYVRAYVEDAGLISSE